MNLTMPSSHAAAPVDALIGRRSWQGAVEDHPEYAHEVAAAEHSIYG